MAVINPKNYYGLGMSDFDKSMFIAGWMKELPEGEDAQVRSHYGNLYMTSTRQNYVLSKPAQETIEKIKLSDPIKVFKMIIEHADYEGATILIDNNTFFRYFPIRDRGVNDLSCIWIQRQWIDDHTNYFLNYDGWRIMEHEYSHPDHILGMKDNILQFIKSLIFLKCTNVESYLMKPQQKARPPHLKDSKWINKSGLDVTLVNADWNRMYIKSEEFAVSGHVRLQPHGKENKQIKIIWIDSYTKKGYKRQFHS